MGVGTRVSSGKSALVLLMATSDKTTVKNSGNGMAVGQCHRVTIRQSLATGVDTWHNYLISRQTVNLFDSL
jgi:hypothetical protein